MTFRYGFAVLILSIGLACTLPAMAAKPMGNQKLLGTFNNWEAFSFRENGQPVCYMALAVTPTQDGHFKRIPAHLMITHRPADNSKDVVSYDSGYNFKPDSTAKVRIGSLAFDMFTTLETAWTRDAVTDHKLAAAIRQGTTMTITGSPAMKATGDHTITDHLVLAGSSRAYQAISKACGYSDEMNTETKSKK